jgi:hypothetical protein
MTAEQVEATIARGGHLLRTWGGQSYLYRPTRMVMGGENPEVIGYFYRDGIIDPEIIPVTITSYWREATQNDITHHTI